MPIKVIQPAQQAVSVVSASAQKIGVYVSKGDQGATGPQGPTGAPGVVPVFTMQDTITAVTGKSRFYFDSARTITQIRVSAGTAPVGAPVIVDVLVNGVSVGPTTLPAGSNTATLTLSKAVASGDYATVSVLSVGTTTPGSDLTVVLTIN
jgi:hypothetical protein